MSRKAVVRNLPKLGSLFSTFQGFNATDNKRHALELSLKKAVLALRSKNKIPFYSMREVSAFFGVSLKSVAIVYESLSKEGHITIVRSSQTILEGARKAPKGSLCGVVGIPVALPSFIYGNNPRAFYIHLEDELRHRNYVVDFIFYSTEEAGSSVLVNRLLAHEMDIAFWMSPAQQVGETMLRLRDAGVHLVVGGDGPGMFPVQQYVLALDSAFIGLAAGWKSERITKVYLIGPERSLAPHFRNKCRGAFHAEGIEVVNEKLTPESFFDRCAGLLAEKRSGLVFLEHFHYENLCNYDWKTMQALFQGKRCFLAQGLVYHSAFSGKTILVDTIEWGFPKIAKKISLDIATQAYREVTMPYIFKGGWSPGNNLGSVDREL